jgi:hypothetical protein
MGPKVPRSDDKDGHLRLDANKTPAFLPITAVIWIFFMVKVLFCGGHF